MTKKNGRVSRQRGAMKYILLVCTIFSVAEGRSLLRTPDPCLPEITTRWTDATKTYTLKDNYLELHPLFSKFDKEYFMDHLLPDDNIPFRRAPEKSVAGTELKKQIEVLLKELRAHKKQFKHFKTLKSDDYNFRTVSGLIILKFKDYPFVLKMFIKTPETFVKPFSEGIIPRYFFRMGGGITRHLAGFTRVKNLEELRKKIDESEYWQERIDTPRKWFLLPENPRWIELKGKHIGTSPEEITELPAVYGSVADEIQTNKYFILVNKADRQASLDFAHYVGNRIDAHIDNFMIEKGSLKMVLVDTEHFPTMVGLKEPIIYTNYTEWYMQLSLKCLKDNFCRTKKYRKALQTNPQREILHV